MYFTQIELGLVEEKAAKHVFWNDKNISLAASSIYKTQLY